MAFVESGARCAWTGFRCRSCYGVCCVLCPGLCRGRPGQLSVWNYGRCWRTSVEMMWWCWTGVCIVRSCLRWIVTGPVFYISSRFCCSRSVVTSSSLISHLAQSCRSWGARGLSPPVPNKKYQGETGEYLPPPSKFLPFCSPCYDLHIIRHFCTEFWGLKLHKISKFSGAPDPAGGTALPRLSSSGEGLAAPSQEPHPRCPPIGSRALAL